MRKAILSVAPVAGGDNEFDPIQVGKDIIECYKLGATQMHLHVRDKFGRLTADMSRVKKAIEFVRSETDMLIEISTGGVSNLTIEERCKPCYEPLVELTSLNVGTINLGNLPYINQIDDVRYCVQKTCENRKHPEVEIFEIGHLYTLKDLDEEFHLERPLMISLVHGFKGAMPANISALKYMVTACQEIFRDEEYYWGVIEAGRKDWNLIETALDWGASILRVGFEDSMWLTSEKKATTNAELIAEAIHVMKKHGVEPMSPKEARDMLHLSL